MFFCSQSTEGKSLLQRIFCKWLCQEVPPSCRTFENSTPPLSRVSQLATTTHHDPAGYSNAYSRNEIIGAFSTWLSRFQLQSSCPPCFLSDRCSLPSHGPTKAVALRTLAHGLFEVCAGKEGKVAMSRVGSFRQFLKPFKNWFWFVAFY